MSCEVEDITVHVKYKDVEKTFSGNAEQVWLSLNRFFGEFLPSFDIATKLVLNVDMQQLVQACQGLIAFSAEGSNLLVSKSKLTDNETLLLLLLSSYVGHKLSKLETDAISKEELQTGLGKSSKITSTRLGELVKNSLTTRTDDDTYRITTFGIRQMQKDILPRIRQKSLSRV